MAMMGAVTGLRGGGDLGFATAFGGAHVEFSTSSGDTLNPSVGDNWAVQITAAQPNSRVTVLGTWPDGTTHEAFEGMTDVYGQWRKNGQFGQEQLGSWSEVWKVGGMEVSRWNFTVRPPQDRGNVAPASLLKPMPSIIPVKPGQVSSADMGIGCRLGSWVNANPLGGVALALGLAVLIKKGFK